MKAKGDVIKTETLISRASLSAVSILPCFFCCISEEACVGAGFCVQTVYSVVAFYGENLFSHFK